MEIKKEEKIKYCHLCSSSSDAEEINFATKQIIETLEKLLINPSLPITEDHLICKSCTENVEKCFNIKTSYLHTEIDYCIDSSFVRNKDNVYVDLMEVYINKNNEMSKDIPKGHTVCRLCIKLAEYDCCFSLEDEIRDATSLKILLSIHFPELDLNKTENPRICRDCYTSLQGYFRFVDKVSAVEKNVKDDIVKVSNLLKCEKDYAEPNIVQQTFKSEDSEEIKLEGDSYCETEIFENNLKPEVYVKTEHEEIDVNMEQPNNDRNQQDPLVEKLHSCSYCEYQSKHRDTLRKHITRTHMNIKKAPQFFQCAVCNYETKQKYTLRRHMKIHMDPSQVTLYNCDSCEYKTKHKHCLTKHMATHAEDNPYQCEVCGLKLKSKFSMRNHMQLHQDLPEIKMYYCDSCSYRTRYKGCFKRHEIVHLTSTEVNMYQCAVCEYKTKHKGSLTKHMVLHQDPSKIAAYQCEFCDYRSKHKTDVRKHLRTVHNFMETTWYRCEDCKFKTKYKLCFDQHVVTHRECAVSSDKSVASNEIDTSQ